MARYIDADAFLLDESEAYISAQIKVKDETTRLVNAVIHKKIQKLIADAPTVFASAVVWHKVTTRPLTEEERAEYKETLGADIEFLYDCEMPEGAQEILIATRYGVDKDICCNDAEYGIGLEEHDDFDGVLAWAAMPEYKEA